MALTLSALSPAASVYVTGSAILRLAGTGAVPAVAIGGVAILLASLLYAEIGAAFPTAGGIYPGIGAILGPAAARVAIVLGLITSPALIAFVALGLADYVHVYAPLWSNAIIIPAIVTAACLIAAMNLTISGRIAMLLLIVELAALAMLIGVGLAYPARNVASIVLHPMMPGTPAGLVATPLPTLLVATVAGAFACAGSGLTLYFADDLTGPPQRIGWLVVVTGVITILLVTLPLLAVCIGLRDPAATLRTDTPIAAFVADRAGAGAAAATTGAVVLAIFNNLVASTIAFGRFLYSTGADGIWPPRISRQLAVLHPRRGSPTVAIGVLGITALLASLIGQRGLLALLSTEVFTALLLVLAVVVGRRRRLTGVDTFRSPFYPLVPIVALAVIFAFVAVDWQDPVYSRTAMLFLAAAALITFLLGQRRGSRPRDT